MDSDFCGFSADREFFPLNHLLSTVHDGHSLISPSKVLLHTEGFAKY